MRTQTALRPLRKRAEYLRERFEERDASPGALGYIEAELKALDYVIEIIEDMVRRDSEDPLNVVKQREMDKWKTTAAKALIHLAEHDPELAKAMVTTGPPGLAEKMTAIVDQKLYGASVPRADDTRPNKRARGFSESVGGV